VCVLVAKGLRSLAITLLQLLIQFDDNSSPVNPAALPLTTKI